MYKISLLIRFSLIALCLFLVACGVKSPQSMSGISSKPYTIRGKTYYPLATAQGFYEEGTASWYGPGFHGKKTASGERFNQNALTAAHKTLPLGTIVNVTNLENGRNIQVKINDRGPFVQNRVIDLSRQAAASLGFVEKGLTKVRIVPVGANSNPRNTNSQVTQKVPIPQNTNPNPIPIPSQGNTTFLEVAIFSTIPEAEAAAAVLKNLGLAGRIIRSSKGFIVQSGPFPSLAEAEKNIAVLKHRFPEVRVL